MCPIPAVTPQLLLDARFSQIDDLCQQVRLWDIDLRPLSKPTGFREAGRLIQAKVHGIDYGFCQLNANLDQYGAAPPGVVTFVIKDEQTGNLWWRNQDTRDNEILVYRAGSELRSISSAGFTIHTLSASQDALGELCQSLKIRFPSAKVLPEVFRVDPAKHAGILSVLREFKARLQTRSGLDLQQVLAVLVRSWVAQANTAISRRPMVRARASAIRTCLDYLDAVEISSLSTADLRRVSGVSERTLEYAFRERFGLTPAVFLKARKLTLVRGDLKLPDNAHQTIGDIAASRGFTHHGHFTSDYRLLFGEAPSQTKHWRVEP